MTTKQERSELFKLFQSGIQKSNSYEVGKEHLLHLRTELSAVYDYLFTNLQDEDFRKMPIKSDKTIAYYLYHLIRIEDITSTLISGETQLFFIGKFDKSLNSPIITTGNELARDDLVTFSEKLNIQALEEYAHAVLNHTNAIIENIDFKTSKTKVSEERKAMVLDSQTVSDNENASWLVDYWCKKTYAGLFLMPFSRHHMLHLNGCMRIFEKIHK